MTQRCVLSIGRIYCDLNFSGFENMPELGQEVYADHLSLHAGGGAFITASYLAAMGCASHALSVLPSAPFTVIVENEARDNAVSINYCSVDTKAAPQVTVALSMSGDRAFLTCRPGGALPADYEQTIDSLVATAGLSHLHIAELATLLEYPDLVERARALQLTVSLDCGWDEASFQHPGIASLIASVDLFLPNEMEMIKLRECGIDEYHAPLTVVKQGGKGATAYSSASNTTAVGRSLTVVDTIGAGDAFNAGYILAWLCGLSELQCLERGNACGAVAVTRRGGATQLPNLNHLSKQLR